MARRAAPILLELPSPFINEPGIVRLAEPRWSDTEALAEQLREERYPKPFLLEQEGLLKLYFTLRFEQSAMRLDDPDALEFGYTRAMMAFLLFRPRPRRLLQIGLGGGALARFCLRHLPACEMLAVEVDPQVIAFRDEFRLPPDGPRFRVVQADGVAWLAELYQSGLLAEREERYDVLLIDAFDRDGIASALMAPDFHEHAHACLSGQGVLAMNLAGDKDSQAHHIAEIRRVFDDRVLLLPVRDDGNQICLAFRQPDFDPRWTWLRGSAREWQKRTGLDFPDMVDRLEKAAGRG